jgi:starvation-inducible DNA-binding protein
VSDIIDELKVSLANHIEGSLIVQGYHWNIEGQCFNQYHDFFGEIYTDYYSQVDTLAEYVRILSDGTEYPNGSTDIVKLNKTISSNPIVGDKAKNMCAAIITINDALISDMNTLSDIGSKEKLTGFVDYCAGRLDALNKLNWKLLAITK